jgi:hypothetical protein
VEDEHNLFAQQLRVAFWVTHHPRVAEQPHKQRIKFHPKSERGKPECWSIDVEDVGQRIPRELPFEIPLLKITEACVIFTRSQLPIALQRNPIEGRRSDVQDHNSIRADSESRALGWEVFNVICEASGHFVVSSYRNFYALVCPVFD